MVCMAQTWGGGARKTSSRVIKIRIPFPENIGLMSTVLHSMIFFAFLFSVLALHSIPSCVTLIHSLCEGLCVQVLTLVRHMMKECVTPPNEPAQEENGKQ